VVGGRERGFDDGGEPMTTKRITSRRGTENRAERPAVGIPPLEERRMSMHQAEGHAGSVPRSNPELEQEKIGERRLEYERLLGH
jgi:hypothetical protein